MGQRGRRAAGRLERRAITAGSDPELRDFINRYRIANLSAEPDFLLSLALHTDSVIDLHEDGQRALVAVLTDAADNAANAVSMTLLASRRSPIPEPLFRLALAEASREARRGPRASLEIELVPEAAPHQACLWGSGFRQRYEMIVMRRTGRKAETSPVLLPPDWTWADLAAETFIKMQHLVRGAFAALPGVNFAPIGHGRERLLGKSPPDRLLLERDKLAGYLSVFREAGGSGLINTLARHPDYRGRNLGDMLMAEALRQLASLDLKPVHLHVAAENKQALGLYERWGFAAKEAVPVYFIAAE